MAIERMELVIDNGNFDTFELNHEKEKLNNVINEFLEFARHHAKTDDKGLPLNYHEIENLGNNVRSVHAAIERCTQDLRGSWSKHRLKYTSIDHLFEITQELDGLVYRKNSVYKSLEMLNQNIGLIQKYFNGSDGDIYLDNIKGMMNQAINEFKKIFSLISDNLTQRINIAREKQEKKSSIRKHLEFCFVM